ncbi:DUF6380 family protein [Streptomyces sp. NPDC012510]
MRNNPVQGGSTGEKRYATLRDRGASLSATTGRASIRHRGRPAGEGAR